MGQDRARVIADLPAIIPNLRIPAEIPIYADYGIRTTNTALVVVWVDGGPQLVEARWGYTPSYITDIKAFRANTINAVSEEVHWKPTYKSAWHNGGYRCFVPINVFYEPEKMGTFSQPWCVYKKDHTLMLVKGLWSTNAYIVPETVTWTFTIFTTTQSPLIETIHDRFPWVADDQDPEMVMRWLNPRYKDLESLQALAAPYPAELMSGHPVGKFVDYNNHGPECIEPLPGYGWGYLDNGWNPIRQEDAVRLVSEHEDAQLAKKAAKKEALKEAKAVDRKKSRTTSSYLLFEDDSESF